ncbi:ribosomal RNA small subunit methyltransferase A [Candidatus Peregrinibacteria bacterium]|nr:MAG: ribosomal RNA small subunit methyltransferase A [Candidatus Peregrinibacteria bacterium]
MKRELYREDLLLEVLEKFRASPNKKLGQNFLLSEDVLDEMIEAAEITADDTILEIGPGPGALTQKLIATPAKKIEAIEFDERILPVLHWVTEGAENFEWHHMNALEFQPKDPNYILVANIPYYLTSPILRHYLGHENKPKKAILLVQKEVAEKICVTAGQFSILSLEVALYAKARLLRHVERELFYPAPKVHSAVIVLDVYDTPKISSELIPIFWQLTKLAFSQKRKKLSNTIGKAAWKNISGTDLLEKSGVSPTIRPQELSLEEWENMAKILLAS